MGVELSICQELCSYQYPFDLPETFLNYQDNFELKVKFVLLKSFCNVSIYKEFPTQEFLEQVSISTSKSAKLKKHIVTVLSELKDHKLIKSKFQVLTKQNKRWTIIMAIGEEFYFYQYPFFFPNSFLIYKNKYDLEIKLQLIGSFSQVELKKIFPVKKCLNQFSVPNKDLTKIKNQLIDSFFELKDSELIENEFSLTFKNGSLNETKKIEDLSPGVLSKIESFSFWEKI